MSVNMSQLNNEASVSNDSVTEKSEIKALLEKNLELTEQLLDLAKKMDSFRKWQQVYGFLKLLIIIVPLVLGVIYLPALLEKALEPYNELLNVGGQATDVPAGAWDMLKSLRPQ